jgi:hypothetical protein
MPRPASSTLRYIERIVACRASAGDIAWLEEFLSPWFETSHSKNPACTVELETDEALVQRLLEKGAPRDATVLDAFAMDRGMQQLVLWEQVDGAQLVFDESLAVFYRLAPDGTRVEISCGTIAPKARIALMRVVRELAMSEARAAGRLLVHGAVLGVGDHGVLIAGPKRAGKTTLLVHALRAGADFVSNDRVVVEDGADGLVASGMPTVVSIRQTTLDVLPELGARLESGRLDHLSSLAEIDSGAAPPLRPRPGRPRHVSAAQLCRALDARARRAAPLRTVVLLRSGSRPGSQVREISGAKACEQLEACVFGTADRSSELFRAPIESGGAEDALRCRDVVERARCLEFELGIGAREAEIRDGLDAVLARTD